ncbi:MAG: lipid A deacylase LpxR family protein [Aliivibrio sp.]|nr:lipid A deacylase LpxR family protein [Aliivibrio sp.]
MNGFGLYKVSMKRIFAIAIGIGLSTSAWGYNSGSVSFNIDNDGMLGFDQGYTNGVFFTFNSASTQSLAGTAPIGISHAAMLLPFNQQTTQGWGMAVGQKMWTPADITGSEEVENDRPYAGLLFVDTYLYEYSPYMSNRYNFMLGTVGPNAYAQESQKLVHEIVGSKEPMGWDNQIDNQLVFDVGYESHRPLIRERVLFDQQIETAAIGRIHVGNFQSEAAIGGVARWGSGLNSSFGSVGFSPGNYVDISVLSSSRSGYFVFVGAEGRYRYNDITIDGDRESGQYSVDIEHWQATGVAGIVFYQANWGVSLSVAMNSPEFEQDTNASSSLGSFELFWRL